MAGDHPQLPLGFFDQTVLASYRVEPDKWIIQSDNFEGRLQLSPQYSASLNERDRNDQYVDISFGYRALASGDLALVVLLPHLADKLTGRHLARWRGFHLTDSTWSDSDSRFDQWVRRYIFGDWSVENGSRSQLSESVAAIRALTKEMFGAPLFRFEVPPTLAFPAAENSHRYQDAHQELYGLLVDGLDKGTIQGLATRLGRKQNVASERTVSALKSALTGQVLRELWQSFEVTSVQRRLASHSARKTAQRFPAFETFSRDLDLWVAGCRELLDVLERVCDIDAQSAKNRQEAMANTPRIVRPAEGHYSICQADEMIGKTIESVEYGEREEITGVHGSELLICHFTDGSILLLGTGSNARNVAARHPGLVAEDFHVDLSLQWVPALEKSRYG